MQFEQIDTVAQAHPLQTQALFRSVPHGATIAEIVAGFDLPQRFGLPQVCLIRGGEIAVIPVDMWRQVRPKAGTRVEIGYAVEGPLVGALASLALSTAAPWIAGTVFGLTGIYYTVAVAAITVVGSLLINALIPPVKEPKAEAQNFSITGVQNVENRYGIYPKVLGRHRIFPPKTARGYSETVGRDVYYRGRMALGWGPVAIEDLKIGTTPIHEFDDVEVEFLNVNQALSIAKYPQLSGITKAWRTGTAPMVLCPDDVAEDGYNVKLTAGNAVTRVTRLRTESASVDISFPSGLVYINKKGGKEALSVQVRFRWRPLAGAWVSAGSQTFSASTTSFIRFTKQINFPAPGEYEIEVMRETADRPSTQDQDDTYFTAIRSFRSGKLPSHEGIAEVAFRLRASEQLSGNVDSLNAIVQQVAPIWTGSGWSAPQAVRHPAWVYLDAIRGGHIRRPVADSRIDLDAFKAWADEEPHWTCDYVVDTETRTAEVLDIIAASGRARRALTDLRYSIIRDGAAGPIRQMFSPRNSWGFKGTIAFPRPIHALRCMVRSERLEWEQDEVTVYADGYDADTATEFETLEIPGVVVTAAEADEGNAWRLGRYHLAQAILRPETYEWHADWEHIRVTRGDKVQLVHDVPVVGIGAARVKAVDAVTGHLTLDEIYDMPSDEFRLTSRDADGTRHSFKAQSPAVPEDRVWVPATSQPTIQAGDLVFIEEVAQETMEVLVTGVFPDGDSARITAVPASPAVLQADQGAIPAYRPIITPGRLAEIRGPDLPVVLSIRSDEATMIVDPDGAVSSRIGVMLEPIQSSGVLASVQLRWRPAGGDDPWVYGVAQPVGNTEYLTEPVQRGTVYEVAVRTISGVGRTRGWVHIGTVLAQGTDAPPPTVTGLVLVPIEQQVQLRWDAVTDIPDLTMVEIRYSASASASWNASVLLERIPYPMTTARVFARAGTYLLKWVDREGRYSLTAASAYISEDRIRAQNAVEVLECSPDWTGTFVDTEKTALDLLVLEEVAGVYPSEGTWTSSTVVDLGAIYPVQITAHIEAGGFSSLDAMSEWTSLAALPALAASNPEGWRVETEVNVSEDGSTWSGWQEISGGDLLGRHFSFRVRLISLREDVTPRVDMLAFVLDMPDRVAGADDVLCPSGGMTVNYDPAFRNLPSVVVTPKDAPTGARVEISSKSRTGFHIQFFDSGGTGIAQTFDWVARGYGREST